MWLPPPVLALLEYGPCHFSDGVGKDGNNSISILELLVNPVPELQASLDVLIEANSDGIIIISRNVESSSWVWRVD